MSKPVEVPKTGDRSDPNSPASSPRSHFSHLIPSPVTTRRTRTISHNERALAGPTLKGEIKSFCREKGHGFVIPESGGDPLFTHISDIDSEFVPQSGDKVNYKATLIPPKNEKMQAVHVTITKQAEGVDHPRWDAPKLPTGTPS